jgi:hypothetical protein
VAHGLQERSQRLAAWNEPVRNAAAPPSIAAGMPTTDQRQLARILANRIRAHRAAGVDLDQPGGEAALARLLARDVSDWLRMREPTAVESEP